MHTHCHDAYPFHLPRFAREGAPPVLQVKRVVRSSVWQLDILLHVVLLDARDRDICVGHPESSSKRCCLREIM